MPGARRRLRALARPRGAARSRGAALATCGAACGRGPRTGCAEPGPGPKPPSASGLSSYVSRCWGNAPSARGSASYQFQQLGGSFLVAPRPESAPAEPRSEEQFLGNVTFPEHDAPEGGGTLRSNATAERGSIQHAGGRPLDRSSVTVRPQSSAPEVPFRDSSPRPIPSLQDDQRQQHPSLHQLQDDLPKQSSQEIQSQLPSLENMQLQYPPQQTPRAGTACGRCDPQHSRTRPTTCGESDSPPISPLKAATLAPPMLRNATDATDLSIDTTLPTVMLPLGQLPCNQYSQRNEPSQQQKGELCVYGKIPITPCLPNTLGDPDVLESPTESGDFNDTLVHEQPTQEKHHQQQMKGNCICGTSSKSSHKSPTTERTLAKVCPESLEINENLQDELLTLPQVTNKEMPVSQDQEINLYSARLPNLPEVSTPKKGVSTSSDGNSTCQSQEANIPK